MCFSGMGKKYWLFNLPIIMKSLPPHRLVRWILSYAALGSVVVSLNSCSNFGGGGMADTGYGPFDSRGNYVEDWADTPEKWSRRASYAQQNADIEPDLAMTTPTEAPPSDLSPIASSSSRQVEVASLKRSGSTSSRTKSSVTSSSRTVAKKAPVRQVAKRPPVKPNATRVVIKRGDTLSGLAAKHRSSVRAIQRANGMRDTKLVAGKTLLIPRL